jgi:hypothetical protein
MTTSGLSLQRYEEAERALALAEARIGLMIHGIVTALVSAALVVVNIAVAPEFPWSAFAVCGMAVGLVAHWWFGFQKLDEQLTAHQDKIEARAVRQS